jgi:Ca2+-binding RTX toxin-like protein
VRLRRVLKFVILSMLGLILISDGSARTASISVPATNVDDSSRGITVNDIKPSECAALDLTALLICPPDCTGTSESELILGGPDADLIKGKGGKDCILGGGGDDEIRGNAGGDVCIGGP